MKCGQTLVPCISDLSHISAWDRRRSQGARPQEYSSYFKVAQRSERRRDRVEICDKSLIQGTRVCPYILGPRSLRRFFVRSPAKNAGIAVSMSRLFAGELAEKRREMRTDPSALYQ